MNPLKLKKFSNQGKDRIIDKKGYVLIFSPFPFSKTGYALEHHLVVEEKINRLLTPGETVHHLNGNKSDNRIENLMLFKNQKEHKSFENKIKQFGFTQNILNQIENRWNNL